VMREFKSMVDWLYRVLIAVFIYRLSHLFKFGFPLNAMLSNN
jgi:hypothetical protein